MSFVLLCLFLPSCSLSLVQIPLESKYGLEFLALLAVCR